MRFKISPVLNIQILSKECTLMLKEVRKFVEGLYIDNPKEIQKALKVLLEVPPAEGEDYIVVVIKEAIDGGYLSPCSKTAAIISGIIGEVSPHRDILATVAEGINETVCQDPNWLNDIIFEDTDIEPEARQAFWDCIDKVQEVRQLFAEARYSSAVDERCVPTPAGSDPKPGSPSIDELCDDEPDSATTEHHRPDPIPSDWKKDDTCAGIDKAGADSGSDTSTGGAPPDANTDAWPENNDGSYFLDDMGYVNYI